ncbi:MAG: TIGR03617 family F420-dependent LLM class oxidoreductase [Chloroflexi bacterium]|nr:TIGR03617 family F420-dependent LLM class oxidoreductase [Chloroflexota bacterium]
MRLETAVMAPTIKELADYGKRMEEMGYDSIVTPEAGRDPFLPLAILAEHTERLKLGTAVAIAFPRSPFVVAQMAWDLQRYSGGRFILGLGTQVKGHNERRYSTPWPAPPGPRLREYILCLKAIFNTFQTNERPNFKGDWYQFTLISPFFNPGPIPNGGVPIYISAINKYHCRLVGEVCDGIRMHPFNTPKYTREVIIPSIEEGAKKAGRKLSDIDVVGGGFLVTGKNEEEVERAKAPFKQQIAFYGSTRSYHPVLECHGWGEVGMALHRLSMEGKWAEMTNEITDEMLNEFAIVGTYDEIVPKIKERYSGVVNTLGFGYSTITAEQGERLRWLIQELKQL